MAKYLEFLNISIPSLKSPIHIDTKGGSNDTDVKELAVKPLGVPSSDVVVTIVTVSYTHLTLPTIYSV